MEETENTEYRFQTIEFDNLPYTSSGSISVDVLCDECNEVKKKILSELNISSYTEL